MATPKTPSESQNVLFHFRLRSPITKKMEPTELLLIRKASTTLGIPHKCIVIEWDEDDHELHGGEFMSKGERLGRFDIEEDDD